MTGANTVDSDRDICDEAKVIIVEANSRYHTLHNGASNEIKEIEVCKKCPKVKPYCGPIFDSIMFKLFWMMQN